MNTIIASGLSQRMIDQLNLYLNGALVCLASGLLLLIIAAIVLRVRNKRSR